MKSTDIAVPKSLKIDQISALFLYVVKVLGKRIEDVVLWFGVGNHPEGAFDLDCEITYSTKKKFSATEALACEFSDLLTIPGVPLLIKDLNTNNGSFDRKNGRSEKGGWLKSLPFSFAALIRNLFDMGEEPIKIVRWYFRIFTVYYAVQLRIERKVDLVREGWENFVTTLPNIGCSEHPLTLSGYAHNLWLLGKTEAEIKNEVLFWSQMFMKAKRWREKAEEIAHLCDKKFFPLGNKMIVAVAIGHPLASSKLLNSRNVVVINHNPDETIAILTNLPHGNLDILRRHLPGWRLERRFQYPMLLLGSTSRDNTKGYSKTTEQLVELIRQHVPVE